MLSLSRSVKLAVHSELSILNRLLYTYLHGNQSALIQNQFTLSEEENIF